MKRKMAMLISICLLSTNLLATDLSTNQVGMSVANVDEDLILFFETDAEGCNVYNEAGQDITEQFYQENLDNYLAGNINEIIVGLAENNVTIALPVSCTESTGVNTKSKIAALPGDQDFTASRDYIAYRELPNGSSTGDLAVIRNFKYQLVGFYTYNASVLDGIIREASTTLAIQTTVGASVGTAYWGSPIGTPTEILFQEVYNINTAADISANGKSVQFSASFYANFIESDDYYWIEAVPFASYFTVTR